MYDRNSYVSPYADASLDSRPNTTNENEGDATSATTSDAAGKETSVKDQKNSIDGNLDTISARSDGKKEITVNVQTYYQVLIDSRDCPHVVRILNLLRFSRENDL